MKITEQQIKDLDNGSATVRQLFPQVFETELEEGVWYKSKKNDNVLFLVTKVFDDFGRFNCFGFDIYKEWLKPDSQSFYSKDYFKANIEEVKQRMTEELVRRGFVKGCSFNTPSGFFGEKNVSGILDFEFFNKYNNWIIYIDSCAVFHNGKFATLIQEPTQKEILQAKIKEIQEVIDKL